MEELGRIFSETEGRDDLLLMEDALDPTYLRSNESETAPISPPFLTPHTPHNPAFSTVSSPTPLTTPHLNSSPNINFNFFSSLTSLLPHSTTSSTSNTAPINLTISHHASSTSPSSKTPEQTNNTFQVFNVFSSVSALSPSTSASSSSSTPSSAQSSSTESFNTATTTTTNSTAGGSSGGCAMSTEDASEDLYAEAACEVCYKAKRSCDRRVPCGRCVRLSRTHLCIQRVRKTPRPRKLKEIRHGSMSFLNKRPSEITIGPSSNNSWILENKNKVPRLAPHHIVQASIVQPLSDIKQTPSLQPQQLNPVPSSSHLHPQSLLQQHHSQQLPPHHQQPQPPPPPPQQVSPRPHPLPRLSSPPSTQPSTTTHTSPQQSHSQLSQSQTTSTLTSTPQLQTMTQLLGIESIDWLSFFADLGSTINGTLLPLISLAIKLEEKPKWGNQLNPFALRTHEEKWITTWHDTISTNREALNKSAFLVKFDRVLCLSMLHLTKGSIQDLFISMFQQQERELFKKRSSPIPSTSSTATSSTSSPPHPSSSPQSPAAKLENNLREVLATTTQQLTQQLSSNSLNNNDNDTIATPLPVIMKGYVSNPCDLHATVVIQWSRKEPKDGLPPHVTLELGSNKEMQRLFGYESRELETDPHIFSRLMHPKDWSTLLSKACNAWIKGSTYMALFATCISKRYIEFPCLLEFRSKVVKEEQALRVYCFFIPVPTTP